MGDLEYRLAEALAAKGGIAIELLGKSSHEPSMRSFVFDVTFPADVNPNVTIKLVPERRFVQSNLNPETEANAFRGYEHLPFATMLDKRLLLVDGQTYYGYPRPQDKAEIPTSTPGLLIPLDLIVHAIGVPIARSMDIVHTERNMAHNDIKPSNIGVHVIHPGTKQCFTRAELFAYLKLNPDTPLPIENVVLNDYDAASQLGTQLTHFSTAYSHPHIQHALNPHGIPIFASRSNDAYQLALTLRDLANKEHSMRARDDEALHSLLTFIQRYEQDPSEGGTMQDLVTLLQAPARRVSRRRMIAGFASIALGGSTLVRWRVRAEQREQTSLYLSSENYGKSLVLKADGTVDASEKALHGLGITLRNKFSQVDHTLTGQQQILLAYKNGDRLTEGLFLSGETEKAIANAQAQLELAQHEQPFTVGADKNIYVRGMWLAYQETKDEQFLNHLFAVGEHIQRLANQRTREFPLLRLPARRTSTEEAITLYDVRGEDISFIEILLTLSEASKATRTADVYLPLAEEFCQTLHYLIDEEDNVHAQAKLLRVPDRHALVRSVDQSSLALAYSAVALASGNASWDAIATRLALKIGFDQAPRYQREGPLSHSNAVQNPVTMDAAVQLLYWHRSHQRPVQERVGLCREIVRSIPGCVIDGKNIIREKKGLIENVCVTNDRALCPVETYEADTDLLRATF